MIPQPDFVVNGLEGVIGDGSKARNGTGCGEKMIAEGFRDPEISHDPGADPHRHRLEGSCGGNGDRTTAVPQQACGWFEAELKVRNRLAHAFDGPGHFTVAPVQRAFDAGRAWFEDHGVIWPGLGQLFELLAQIAPLQRMHGYRGLFEEND